jgi:small subunit ribosomal protein S11e
LLFRRSRYCSGTRLATPTRVSLTIARRQKTRPFFPESAASRPAPKPRKNPKTQKTGTYIDKKCPFTGDVSIRGRILTGIVRSAKMQRTIVVRRDYLHYVKKYARYEKRHSNLSAHVSPCFRVREGDTVVVGQCRPLSKTVRFNVLRVIPAGASDKKAFAGF